MEKFVRRAFRSANIIGMSVTTSDQKELGVIEELVVDVESGEVAYVVLSFGGYFGFGDKFFAVPWSEFSITRGEAGNHFTVDTSVEKLRKLPGIDKKSWPEIATTDWDTVLDEHMRQDPWVIPADEFAWRP